MAAVRATDRTRLLIDVGGTNVRFGFVRNGALAPNITTYRVADFATFNDALARFLEHDRANSLADDGAQSAITSAVVAAAGPVSSPGTLQGTSKEIRITNTGWIITPQAICSGVNADVPVDLLNDLEAVALALPFLPDDKVDWIQSGDRDTSTSTRKLAINVGTGFGSATLIDTHRSGPGRYVACPAESGHMLLATGRRLLSAKTATQPHASDDETDINTTCLAALEKLHGQTLTVESVLSGSGVSHLAAAVRAWLVRNPSAPSTSQGIPLQGDTSEPFDLANDDPVTRTTRRIFTRLLAEASANLVLASAAWGGVYFCGSVATAWAKSADRDDFTDNFTGTTPMRHMLTRTPVGIIDDLLPSFIGLAHMDQ